MNNLKNFYKKQLKYDLINKFFYTKTYQLTKINKIILNFGCKTGESKILAANLLALELLTNQKGKLTKTKQANILFKTRKGNFTGCKVTLNKNQSLYFIKKYTNFFINKTITEKKFVIKQINSVTFIVIDCLKFNELENYYNLFQNITKLTITIVLNKINYINELNFLLISLKIKLQI